MEQTDKGAPGPEVPKQEKVIKPLDFKVTALKFLSEVHVSNMNTDKLRDLTINLSTQVTNHQIILLMSKRNKCLVEYTVGM